MKSFSKNLTSWFLAGLVLFFAISSTATHVGFGDSAQTSFSPRSASFSHLFSFFNSSSRRFAANRLVEQAASQDQAIFPALSPMIFSELNPVKKPIETCSAVVVFDSFLLPLRI